MIDYTTPPVAAFREELWKFWRGEENNIGQAGHDLLAFIDAMNKPTDEPRGNGEYGEVFGKPAAERSECKATPCAVPEGYVLVPVEPTTAMKCRAVEAWEGPAVYKSMFARGLADLEDKAADCWAAMLAAANKENNS